MHPSAQSARLSVHPRPPFACGSHVSAYWFRGGRTGIGADLNKMAPDRGIRHAPEFQRLGIARLEPTSSRLGAQSLGLLPGPLAQRDFEAPMPEDDPGMSFGIRRKAREGARPHRDSVRREWRMVATLQTWQMPKDSRVVQEVGKGEIRTKLDCTLFSKAKCSRVLPPRFTMMSPRVGAHGDAP